MERGLKKKSPFAATDINRYGHQHFFYRHTPPSWHPFIALTRLDRPVGYMLLFLPAAWGLALGGMSPLKNAGLFFYGLFFVGAVLMRSAGCIINDMADRHLDMKVARTALRPLASGELSLKKASLLLGALFALSLLILLQLNGLAILLGVCSLGLVAVYPFMKRFTYWPQLFLGFTFNWGVLMGYAAARETLDIIAFIFYGIGILWTLVYDTIYAHQDIEDDMKIGVKSSALYLKGRTKPVLSIFIVLMGLLFVIAFWGREKSLFYASFLGGGLLFLFYDLFKTPLKNPQACLAFFKRNTLFGVIVFLALICCA